jgi:hypothetical protein
MDERTRRIGLNEALFRQVNEEIERRVGDFESSSSFKILCECGDGGCAELIGVSLGEYEEIRSDATLFFVVPGHELAESERVVVTQGSYSVVQKLPGPATRLAQQTDPR